MNQFRRQLLETRLSAFARIAAIMSLLCVSLAWMTQRLKNTGLMVRGEAAQADLERERKEVSELDQLLQRKDERVQSIAKAISGEIDRRNRLLVSMTEIVKRVDQLKQQRDIFQLRRQQIAKELRNMDDHYLRTKQQRHE